MGIRFVENVIQRYGKRHAFDNSGRVHGAWQRTLCGKVFNRLSCDWHEPNQDDPDAQEPTCKVCLKILRRKKQEAEEES